jgi:hypothetical protein
MSQIVATVRQVEYDWGPGTKTTIARPAKHSRHCQQILELSESCPVTGCLALVEANSL